MIAALQALFPLMFTLAMLGCSQPEEEYPGGDEGQVDNSVTESAEGSEDVPSYLALGDSYTIGEGVCKECSFPVQLWDSINPSKETGKGALKIIARTGWTTAALLDALQKAPPANDYKLVSLLIGVNNQYRGLPFGIYEDEFPALLRKAIAYAGGDPARVLVVSIPDYAFTPFGQGLAEPASVSREIDRYNAFAKLTANRLGAQFINITDISREGLENRNLVAGDGLHPSGDAYARFVRRLAGPAIEILNL